MAHPDDVEFQIGGTLAKYAKRGDEVSIAVATNGNIGSFRMGKAEIAKVRRGRGAEVRGSDRGEDLSCMDFDDEFLMDTPRIAAEVHRRRAGREAGRDVRPRGVQRLQPGPRHGGLPGVHREDQRVDQTHRDGAPARGKVPALFNYSTLAFCKFIPEYYVDITDTYATKKQMFLCHDSQQGDWCRDAFGVNYVDMMESEAKLAATQAGTPGCEYAEVFKLCKSWPTIAGAYKLLP